MARISDLEVNNDKTTVEISGYYSYSWLGFIYSSRLSEIHFKQRGLYRFEHEVDHQDGRSPTYGSA